MLEKHARFCQVSRRPQPPWHLLSDDLNHAEPRSACDPDQGEGAYLTMGEIGLVLGVGDVCWCTRMDCSHRRYVPDAPVMRQLHARARRGKRLRPGMNTRRARQREQGWQAEMRMERWLD